MYPGRYEQTQETESKADLQRRLLAAVAAMAMERAMITLHIPSKLCSGLQFAWCIHMQCIQSILFTPVR